MSDSSHSLKVHRIVCGGLPVDSGARLRAAFPDCEVVESATGEATLAALRAGAELLLLDDGIAEPDAPTVLIRARTRLGMSHLAVVLVHGDGGGLLSPGGTAGPLGIRHFVSRATGDEGIVEAVAAVAREGVLSPPDAPAPTPPAPPDRPAHATATSPVRFEPPPVAPRRSSPESTSTAPHVPPDEVRLPELSRDPVSPSDSSTEMTPGGVEQNEAENSSWRADPPDATAEAMAKLWERFKGVNIERVEALQEATRALQQGALDGDGRHAAEREAHKLAGSVGTFGFAHGSVLAREIEHALQGDDPISVEGVERLRRLVQSLRRELELTPAADLVTMPQQVMGGSQASLLIVDDDRDTADRIAAEANARAMRTTVVSSVGAARQATQERPPDVVLLDLSFPDASEDGLTLLEELHGRRPPIPVVVFTVRDTFVDRVRVAALGGRGFLKKTVPSGEVLDTVARILEQSRAAESKVLAVDDDPLVLATLRSVLEPHGITVTTLEDPLRFWDTLEQVGPDLLMLDVDMPGLTGIELCRVVRNDARWSALPILFLTGRTDAATLRRVFAAGADDFVNKPIIGPELVTRIRNRLERTQLYRSMAETDPLTGVANRRKSSQLLGQFLRLADRHDQPLSLSILDIDHFKRINDSYGHAVGDVILQQFAKVLTQTFRSEDVVARWGGEEFLVGMYGMARGDGVQRVANALEHTRNSVFTGTPDESVTLTFSAGVAQYPDDGTDLLTLYRAADEALYAAKAEGRNRVVPVGWSAPRPVPSGGVRMVDVVLVSRDDDAAQATLHALETRGYRTQWFGRSADAIDALLSGESPFTASAVLLDDGLPENGMLEAVQRLHTAGALQRIRVILLAERSREADAKAALELGVFDRVVKPVRTPVLVQRVRRALEHR